MFLKNKVRQCIIKPQAQRRCDWKPGSELSTEPRGERECWAGRRGGSRGRRCLHSPARGPHCADTLSSPSFDSRLLLRPTLTARWPVLASPTTLSNFFGFLQANPAVTPVPFGQSSRSLGPQPLRTPVLPTCISFLPGRWAGAA